MKTAEYWIRKLNLKAHPEGGYYREIYKSSREISTARGRRPESTAIYFLLKHPAFSAFHKIESDEIWHFYAGEDVVIWILSPKSKKLKKQRLGNRSGIFQAVVPAGMWFGASLDKPGSYTLVGCTVAPGFDFKDFEMAQRKNLLKYFPSHLKVIRKLTAEQS